MNTTTSEGEAGLIRFGGQVSQVALLSDRSQSLSSRNRRKLTARWVPVTRRMVFDVSRTFVSIAYGSLERECL